MFSSIFQIWIFRTWNIYRLSFSGFIYIFIYSRQQYPHITEAELAVEASAVCFQQADDLYDLETRGQNRLHHTQTQIFRSVKGFCV